MTDPRYEALMVKVVDDVASPAEREELMSWLVAHPEERAEFEAQQALKALTDGWVTRLEHDLHLDQHEASASYRGAAGVGTALILGASLTLGLGTLAELWMDPEVPLWVNLGMSMGAAGTVVLLLAAIRWRMRAHDPYSEVIR